MLDKGLEWPLTRSPYDRPMSSYTRKRPPARKPQNRRTSPARKGTPAWLWFASGLAVGIFLMLIKNVGGEKTIPVADAPEQNSPTVDSRPRPRFDFYDLLPESRVPVGADRPEPPSAPTPVAQTPVTPEPGRQPPTVRPEPAIVSTPSAPVSVRPETPPSSTPAAEQVTASSPTVASNRLLLQAGSFRSQGDADNLRAQLLLMGLSASIETFSPNQSETWHRVIVGPYDNHQSMDSARSQLTANGIDTLMLRR